MNEELFVIKIGGREIENEQTFQAFIHTFKHIHKKKILIHGGGNLATQWAKKMDIPVKMIDGRRITDKDNLDIITAVYGGLVNKKVVSHFQKMDINAIGLSGADGRVIVAEKRKVNDIDYGWVGDIKNINVGLLEQLLSLNIVPVVCPISLSLNGDLLNTNADTVATEIAKAMAKHYDISLILAMDKMGVLGNVESDKTLINSMNHSQYKSMKQEGKIHSGMIPKLDNGFDALNSGVKIVKIGKIDSIINQNTCTILTK